MCIVQEGFIAPGKMEVERASSEILYTSSVSTSSLITAGSTLGGGVGGRGHNDAQAAPFARSRRSLAEPTTASGHLQVWSPIRISPGFTCGMALWNCRSKKKDFLFLEDKKKSHEVKESI